MGDRLRLHERTGAARRNSRSAPPALERERETEARAAVAEERARIAREMHDVVAHSLSVMVVQAEAAEAMLDVDPERARRPLAAVQDTGRAALDRAAPHARRAARDGRRRRPRSRPSPASRGLDDLVEQRARGRAAR